MATGEAQESAAHGALPIRNTKAGADFDVVETYHRLLAEDEDLTMPVAAIEALIAVLGQTESSTVMETLDIIKAAASKLAAACLNPIPPTAGTDLFQQYLITSLKQPGSLGGGGGGAHGHGHAAAATHENFDDVRRHLLRNGRLFADRAKDARDAIAARGARFVREGSVVLTAGGSRSVRRLLLRAADRHVAETGLPRFRVVYVVDERARAEAGRAIAALRHRGVPVAAIAPEAVAHALLAERVGMVFVGAENVVQNGGILSRLGTFQIAQLAKATKKPFYVVAETHKLVRVYPLNQADLVHKGIRQTVVDYRTDGGGDEGEKEPEPAPTQQGVGDLADPVDYTPPDLITSIITEQGVKMPSAMYAMLLEIYN